MTDFFKQPILNSPYDYPSRHWELDEEGQPTNRIEERRRRAEFITPIPKAKKRKKTATQEELGFGDATGISTERQKYDPTPIINELRGHVDTWRTLPNPHQWHVTPETARLLQHWRHHPFNSIRPFFCQVEAVETLIWLAEVAPQLGREGRKFIEHVDAANAEANPGLDRVALKLATGAGKTTVMAMIIAWQTINAVRRPNSRKFTRGFLVVSPGLTIRDRLRVLQPNDPDAYYQSRELVPADMVGDLGRAKIVITNFHAFKLRETLELSKGGRALLQGRGPEIESLETDGQMLQRVMPELMGIKDLKPSASTALTYTEFLDSMAFVYNLDSPNFVTVSYRDLIRSWAEQQGAPHEDWDIDESLAAVFSVKGRIDGRSPSANNLIFVGRMVVRDAEAILAALLRADATGDESGR